jgi:Thoeris protein ThsB, TIR-like domain
MIVHNVTTEKRTKDLSSRGEHKKIYVGCAESDVRYRDMMVNFRVRWGFYTNNTFEFLTSDRGGLESDQWKQFVEEAIRESDGVMIMVSEHTALDPGATWEIDCALSNTVPIVGVDIRKDFDSKIPKELVGKMTRYGWAWFAEFIDGL